MAQQRAKLAQALQEAQAGHDLHGRAAAEYDAQIRGMAEQVSPLCQSARPGKRSNGACSTPLALECSR